MSVEIVQGNSPSSLRSPSPDSEGSSSPTSLSYKIDSGRDSPFTAISPSRVSSISLDSDVPSPDSQVTPEGKPVRFWSESDSSSISETSRSSSPHSSTSIDSSNTDERSVVTFHYDSDISSDEMSSVGSLSPGKKTEPVPQTKSRVQKVKDYFKKEKHSKAKEHHKTKHNTHHHHHDASLHQVEHLPQHLTIESTLGTLVDGISTTIDPSHATLTPSHGPFHGVMISIMAITNIWVTTKINKKKIELAKLAQAKQSARPIPA